LAFFLVPKTLRSLRLIACVTSENKLNISGFKSLESLQLIGLDSISSNDIRIELASNLLKYAVVKPQHVNVTEELRGLLFRPFAPDMRVQSCKWLGPELKQKLELVNVETSETGCVDVADTTSSVRNLVLSSTTYPGKGSVIDRIKES